MSDVGLIEAGWNEVLRQIGPDTPRDQIDDTRLVFFAGARHMFLVLNKLKDEDQESIGHELLSFQEQLEARAAKESLSTRCVGGDGGAGRQARIPSND